jgi:hypothetical protein
MGTLQLLTQRTLDLHKARDVFLELVDFGEIRCFLRQRPTRFELAELMINGGEPIDDVMKLHGTPPIALPAAAAQS